MMVLGGWRKWADVVADARKSRDVQVIGCAPHPKDAFVIQHVTRPKPAASAAG